MAHEIRYSWYSGQTNLMADVFKSDGTDREIDISLTENGTGRLYLGSCATIEPGDSIVIHQGGVYLSSATYQGDQLNELWRWFYKKKTATKSQVKTYNDDGSVATTQTTTFDDKTKTVGNAS